MRKQNRILLTGGGSGGHISPNLAIATVLKQKQSDLELLYVGSRLALDAELVKPSGIAFKAIFTGKLRRYFSWQNFIDPLFVLLGFFQSFFLLIRFWPRVVFAKGGFVSLPVVAAAFLLRRPIILHESDSVMGLSNRLLARIATTVCTAFPGVTDKSSKEVMTGNPVRTSILHGDPTKGFELTGFRPEKPVMLVWGGSQGSQEINELLHGSLSELISVFQIVHVTGLGKQTEISHPAYRQFEYIADDLKHIYAITNLVVTRGGANSLYELALMQKPNIIIPLKTAAHNHQQINAEYFEQMGASLILRDESLSDLAKVLWHNKAQYDAMKDSLKSVSRPHAASDIAQLILTLNSKS